MVFIEKGSRLFCEVEGSQEDCGVQLPPSMADKYVNYFNNLDITNAYMAVDNIAHYQKMPKKHKNEISDYCLYLGTFQEYDLYSLALTYRPYTTGIVFGDWPGNYLSGWIQLPLDKKEGHEHYAELFKRECACYLITDDLNKEVGRYYTDKVGSAEELAILKSIRDKPNCGS